MKRKTKDFIKPGTIVLLLLILALNCGGKTRRVRPGSTARQPGLNPVFVSAQHSVFIIGSEAAGPQGTSFLIRYKNKRYLVTNFHVIGMLNKLYIETKGKVVYKDIRVAGVDRQRDVAILEANALPQTIPGLPYSLEYMTSQKIYVIGYPNMRSKNNHLNFGTGVISDANYMAPPFMGKEEVKNIQITAPINPGHSGSPVLNIRGEVIGVVSWRFSKESDLQAANYAVPFQYVVALLEQLEKLKKPVEQLYPEGQTCTEDSDCKWLYYCINGKCQKLRDEGQQCWAHSDCYLPYNCFDGVCSKRGSPGDSCQSDSQCLPPNYCIKGQCRPLGKIGDVCQVDSDCQMPLYCIKGKCVKGLSGYGGPCDKTIDCQPPLVCKSGKCRKASEGSCTIDDECYPLYCIAGKCRNLGNQGDPCGKTIDCKSGLACKSGVCMPLSNPGEPCSSDMDCKLPYYCINSRCQSGENIPKSSVQGSSCTSDIQCQPPLYCILGKCKPLGYPGEACGIDSDCNMPLFCIGGKCQYKSPGGKTMPEPGKQCTDDSQCAPPLYCIVGQCRPLSGPGENCQFNSDCLSHLFCIGGTCQLHGPGKSCSDDSQCSPPFYCILGKCSPLGSEGDSCQYDQDCKMPLFCSGGKCTVPLKSHTKTGGQKKGSWCESDADCLPPLYCIMHKCKPLGKEGEPCTIDADCIMPLICRNSKCENPAKGLSGDTPLCKTDKDCKKHKSYKFCIMGQCRKTRLKAGEPCMYTSDCKKELHCIVGTCRKEKSDRGQPCNSNDDCKKPFICRGSICTQVQ